MKNIFGVGIIILCVLMTGCVTTNFTSLNGSVVDPVITISDRSPLVITYFYSPSCGWCNMMSADFDNLTKYHGGEFTLMKYDVTIEKDKFNEAKIKYNNSGYYPFVVVNNVAFVGYRNDTQFKIEEMIVNRI